jgi:hypothetical protein
VSEAHSSVTSQAPAFNKRGLFDIVCGLPILFLCAIAFWKGPIWPDKIGIVVGLVPPWLLILLRAWNHRRSPDQLPVRWRGGSRLEARLVALGWGLTAAFAFFMFPWIFFDESKHFVVVHACILIALTAQCWAEFLDRYIADRKYIPPPSTPSDPSKPGSPA